MTTTIKWSASLFVATLLGTTTGGLFGFASPAAAAEPDAAPAPADAAPPPPVQTAQAGTANEPSNDTDSPAEMKFGRSGRAAAPSSPPPAPSPSASTAEPAPVARARPRTMEEVAGASIQELTFRSVRWRYSLNFFGDVSMSGGKPSDGEHAFGFGLGGQDILIRGELSENIVTTTEMAFEAGEDGGIGVDLERFNVRWQSSRYFVEAGRTHTSFGYWNNAYHHGRWLQPTIERPRWVAFEDDGGIHARALGRRRRGSAASRR